MLLRTEFRKLKNGAIFQNFKNERFMKIKIDFGLVNAVSLKNGEYSHFKRKEVVYMEIRG